MHTVQKKNLKYNVGFTLVELLIVVVMMSTLATMVIPSFSGAMNNSSSGAVLQNTLILQDAIDRYRADLGFYPGPNIWVGQLGCPGYDPKWGARSDGERLSNRLVMYADATGLVCDSRKDRKGSEYPFGPYISKQLPINPVNGSRHVYVSAKLPGSGTDLTAYGWVYSYETGSIRSASGWQ